MKKCVFIMLVLALFAGPIAKAGNPGGDSFSKEIYSLLNDLPIEIEEDLLVNLVITFNHDHELVVLSVDVEDPYVEKVIKNRLNYKKIKTRLDSSIQEYTLPVRIKM